MNDPQTFTAGLQCTLSNLSASSMENLTGTQLEKNEPFRLSVTITFSDTIDGNLANLLMPLELAIRVNFSARSFEGPSREIDLGHITLNTTADVLTYTPVLVIQGGAESVGLNPNEVYQIRAIVRVGHAPFSTPVLGRGFINGLDLPVGKLETLPIKPVKETASKQPETNKAQTPTKSRSPRSRSVKA